MKWRRGGLALVLFGLAGAAGLWFARAAHVRQQVRLARGELDRQQVRAAMERLEALSKSWMPGRDDETMLWLGKARWMAGRRRAALEAFRTVRPEGTGGTEAALYLAEAELGEGRFHEAESRLLAIGEANPAERASILPLVDRLYRIEGRNDELRIYLRRQLELDRDTVPTIRALWQLDRGVAPLESLRKELRRAGPGEPADDRAWLGLARVAIAAEQLDEADAWLKKCESKAPDTAVRRARLDWAEAAHRPDVVIGTLRELRPEALQPAEWWRWRAWLLHGAGDRIGERTALLRRLDCEPGRPVVLELLADLAAQAGDVRDAAVWRRLKAESDRAMLRYDRLLTETADGAKPSEFLELARTAEAAGRPAEALAWARLANRSAGDDPGAAALRARLESRRAAAAPVPAEVMAGLEIPSLGSTGRAFASSTSTRVRYRDEAEVSRLTFVFENGESSKHRNPEALGGGIGLLDYDQDGWQDVYVMQGGPFPPPGPSAGGDRLFRNRGDGTFEDATQRAGLDKLRQGYGHGVSVGDLDNDGDPDLIVTRWRSYAVYRNDGGRFVDVTEAWGLGGDRGWPSSSALADLDGDGDLDLYVCHYMRYDPETTPPCLDEATNAYICCRPGSIPAEADHLFRNDGGKFVDVTREAGVLDENGRGLGVVAADLDGDGKVDLFVANDTTANYLFRNLGGLRFEEVGHVAGVAGKADGGYQAGMGIACGDLDGDGRFDLAVTNYYAEGTVLYKNLGHGLFADRSAATGLGKATRYRLGFGIAFLDADNDGGLDVIQANGHLYPYRDRPYRMPLQLLVGRDDTLIDIGASAGPLFTVPRLGRALASGDLDNDGRVDAVVIDHNAPLVYLCNRTEPDGRWLVLRLEGTASNRDAVGAVVTVKNDERTWFLQRNGGGSYQSASDPRLHLGLGDGTGPVSVEVRWPSGRVDRHGSLETDAAYHLREGDGTARSLAGYSHRR
jgi:hypothetical protein